MNKEKTIKIRKEKLQEALVEQLKRTPTIELACEKSGISRMTYYRWVKASKKFARLAEEAIIEGRLFISDIVESQIFSLIRDKKFEAIRFWLANNDPRYSNKLEIKGHITSANIGNALTREQEKLLKKALALALPEQNYEQDANKPNESPENVGKNGEGQGL